MEAAVDLVATQVPQRVVHPAHVPFEAESQSAEVGHARHAGPGRRLLGDGHRAREELVDRRVGLLQELHGLEILSAAVDVRSPAARRPRVIEIEHRCHRVDAQSVDVEFVDPIERVGDEEVAHFASPEVENVCAPVELLAPHRIGVLIQWRAVEAGQRPFVLGEVRGDPVDEHRDSQRMQMVDEVPEVVGLAEAGRRCVVRRDLISPRTTERVLCDGEEFDVGEALLDYVGAELLSEFAIVEPLAP